VVAAVAVAEGEGVVASGGSARELRLVKHHLCFFQKCSSECWIQHSAKLRRVHDT
jgi:hypothetical protein